MKKVLCISGMGVVLLGSIALSLHGSNVKTWAVDLNDTIKQYKTYEVAQIQENRYQDTSAYTMHR